MTGFRVHTKTLSVVVSIGSSLGSRGSSVAPSFIPSVCFEVSSSWISTTTVSSPRRNSKFRLFRRHCPEECASVDYTCCESSQESCRLEAVRVLHWTSTVDRFSSSVSESRGFHGKHHRQACRSAPGQQESQTLEKRQ